MYKKDLLHFSIQVKRQEDQRGAALIRAAKAGDVSRLEELLNDGADVNFQDQLLGMDLAWTHGPFSQFLRGKLSRFERF